MGDLMICAAMLAGGVGSRLKQGIPKQFVHINHKPILVHSVETFLNVNEFDKIIVSSPKDFISNTKSDFTSSLSNEITDSFPV